VSTAIVYHRRTLVLATAVALALGVGLALLLSADAHAALQKLAGYEKASDNRFNSLYAYLANLRDAILPLAIPVSTIGLVVVPAGRRRAEDGG
jgi:rRNA pseudouridine-1189 N-methylase Emg1 (Nep1/Mra1 family)